jgi:PTH1 family peptidyl-tRNA hydrolase
LRIVAGLGNPGLNFAWSRHNFGFLTLDYLASTINQKIDQEEHFYLYLKSKISHIPVLFVKPQIYMNNSGIAIRQVLDDNRASIEDLIILHDDVDIPLGNLRIKKGGQPAGHKGLISIINYLHTNDFIRIRLGIGPEQEVDISLTDYVLQAFSDEELPLVERTIDRATKAIAMLLTEGLYKAMTIFNRKNYNNLHVEET